MRLTLENVRKEYGETVALGGGGPASAGDNTPASGGGNTASRGVDLDVDDGEFFTLVGPSGCGKTTTLRLVAGFERPTAGTIRFDGRDVGGVPPEARGVGVVFQNYALFPHLSVAENVAYGLRFADPPGGESRDERVASLLDLVDLPGTGDRDPTELSGGQQQRVALARALAPGPDLLLLDEPMSALDARLRERLRMQVKEIQSTLGITTLYVTHDQEEALAISDRVAVMNGGRIEQVGTPRAVYRRPATRFVAEFVGDNNVFEGRVVSVDRAASVHHETAADRNRSPTGSPGSVVDSGESPVETKGSSGERKDERVAGSKAGEADHEGAESGTGDREPRDAVDESGRSAEESNLIRVDVEGVTFAVRTERSVDAGDRVTFCVRPEQMRILGDGGKDARGATANVLDATVSKTEFLGESTRTYLRWKGRELRVRSAEPLAGDVRVSFDASDAHLVEVNRR